ncbi:hypothetical protein ACX8XP_08630 [Calditrichota bacterium LG25]
MEIKDFSLRSKGQIALFRINSKNAKWRFQGSQAANQNQPQRAQSHFLAD